MKFVFFQLFMLQLSFPFKQLITFVTSHSVTKQLSSMPPQTFHKGKPK